MHVLLLTGDLTEMTGGPPRVVFDSAEALANGGATVTIFSLAAAGDDREQKIERFIGLSVNVKCFKRSAPRRMQRSRSMRLAIAQGLPDFDVLHVHGIWEGCLCDAAALFRQAGKPVFVSAHGMLDKWSLRQSRWRKELWLRFGTGRMLSDAQAIVFATSDESAQARHPGITRHAVIANGIDLVAVAVSANADPARIVALAPIVATPGRTILYFSRIHPKKGLDLLVDAFISLADRHPDTRLLIMGIPEDTPFLSKVKRLIASAGLFDRVTLITDLYGAAARPALGLASIFVLPSHQEGFSIAILEALAASCPVLITNQCHFPEVADWGAGLVVTDTSEGVTKGLAELLALSPCDLRNMGLRGRTVVAEKFAAHQIAAQLRRLYEEPESISGPCEISAK